MLGCSDFSNCLVFFFAWQCLLNISSENFCDADLDVEIMNEQKIDINWRYYEDQRYDTTETEPHVLELICIVVNEILNSTFGFLQVVKKCVTLWPKALI